MEKLLDIYISSVLNEGERYLKIQALKGSLEIVKVVRKLAFVQIGSIFTCVLFVVSAFATLQQLFFQFEEYDTFSMNAFSIFTLFLSLVSVGGFFLFFREKRWLDVLGLTQKVNELGVPRKREPPSIKESEEPGASRQTLHDDDITKIAAALEKTIDQKVKESLAQSFWSTEDAVVEGHNLGHQYSPTSRAQ